MATNSKIEWTTHTFNPWRGCTKVSAGCANCYAETMSKRNPKVLGIWGDNGTRVVASESMWREPHKWNAAAESAGEMDRVFCASLADVCEDRPELEEPRSRLRQLIHRTKNLNWLLLTKRPENLNRLFFGDEEWPQNVWAGTSVENQATADERIPHLLRCPARVRFLSVEPLLEAISLNKDIGGTLWIGGQRGCDGEHRGIGTPDCPRELHHHHDNRCGRGVDWVIVGGESGHGARPYALEWPSDIIGQCRSAGVPVFHKQCGSFPVTTNYNLHDFPDGTKHVAWGDYAAGARLKFKDSKGGDMSEWPEDLRVREFPK